MPTDSPPGSALIPPHLSTLQVPSARRAVTEILLNELQQRGYDERMTVGQGRKQFSSCFAANVHCAFVHKRNLKANKTTWAHGQQQKNKLSKNIANFEYVHRDVFHKVFFVGAPGLSEVGEGCQQVDNFVGGHAGQLLLESQLCVWI